MSIDFSRTNHFVDYEQLEILGAALREARVNRRPPITLVEIGSDTKAPRRWSHSHLSKVERGIEVPKEELVRWYEVRTGKPSGYLVNLFHRAVGTPEYGAWASQVGCERGWAFDRIEIFADLSGEFARIYETLDLVALSSGMNHDTVVIDPHDLMVSSRGCCVEVVEGGTLSRQPMPDAGWYGKLEVDLHREFEVGDWHRVRLLHTAISFEGISRWITLATRHGETREFVASLKFNEDNLHPAWRIDQRFAAEVVAAFGPDSVSSVDDVFGVGNTLVTETNGLVRARFESLRPGLQYGIGWR